VLLAFKVLKDSKVYKDHLVLVIKGFKVYKVHLVLVIKDSKEFRALKDSKVYKDHLVLVIKGSKVFKDHLVLVIKVFRVLKEFKVLKDSRVLLEWVHKALASAIQQLVLILQLVTLEKLEQLVILLHTTLICASKNTWVKLNTHYLN
jgi:alanine dehydrogenase